MTSPPSARSGGAAAIPPGAALSTELAGKLAAALQALASGAADRAEALYREVLSERPDTPDALHLLGVLALQRGESEEAVGYIERAIAVQPGTASYRNNLGNALRRLGRLDEAAAAFEAALALKPEFAEAHANLGNALRAGGRLDEAAEHYRLAIGLKPDFAKAHHCLALTRRMQGRPDEAVTLFERARALDPDNAGIETELGDVLMDLGRFDDAVDACRRAVRLRPGSAEAHANLGNALNDRGDLDTASAAYRRAIEIDPGLCRAHYNLGLALRRQGNIDAAIDAYRRALDIDGELAEAHYNLGNALRELARHGEAGDCYRAALAVRPAYADAHSNLLFSLCQDAETTAGGILAEARRWDRAQAAPLAGRARPHANDADPERRLRIGYLSPDFREHAVNYFLEPLIANHDARAVEIFCYAEVARPDAATARYRELAEGWRSTVGMDNSAVAERIREDRIDILVDLAGHTAGNRLLAMAERPAPVQVSHLIGLGQTTGMAAVDYVLTDPWLTPEGFENRFRETPWRLPRCCFSFRPSADWPKLTLSPAQARGFLTFAALANPSRIAPPAVAAWAQVLEAVPGARLLLKHRLYAQNSLRLRLTAAFDRHGVADRVDFEGVERGWAAEMDVYERLDIVLDSFPMSGTTTTCIALWMGLPVVALASPQAHDFFAADILAAVGLGEGIASGRDDFVARAAALAGDVDRLAELRASLRERMRASPLLDHEGCARAVEEAYRGMWRKWCAGVA